VTVPWGLTCFLWERVECVFRSIQTYWSPITDSALRPHLLNGGKSRLHFQISPNIKDHRRGSPILDHRIGSPYRITVEDHRIGLCRETQIEELSSEGCVERHRYGGRTSFSCRTDKRSSTRQRDNRYRIELEDRRQLVFERWISRAVEIKVCSNRSR